MKTIYLIGGTMGVGKTTVCQQLKQDLFNSVFLDGDWCWDANPFQVNEETKAMVIDNICYLLNNFLHCSAYENVIFCWVMHQQSIIDSIIEKLDLKNCDVKCISLIADEINLRDRLKADIKWVYVLLMLLTEVLQEYRCIKLLTQLKLIPVTKLFR